MLEPKDLDAIAQQLSALLPEGFSSVHEDLQAQFRQVTQTALTKLELVSREEFDVQRKVLARTRAKVDALEKQIADMEAQLLSNSK
jgi:ubiquinone biosynthesis accessory factor UbiK